MSAISARIGAPAATIARAVAVAEVVEPDPAHAPRLRAGALKERPRRAVASQRGARLRRGIAIGGVLVLVGIILALTFSVWEGLLLVLIGLAVFGWFAKDKK